MSSSEVVFKGYAVTDPKKWSDFSVIEFTPKNFDDDDVEIAITHCGVCGSDVHTINGGWGEYETPLIAGHEIVGIVKRVGKNAASEFKVDQRVGVGAQIGADYTCRACKEGAENFCSGMIDTYNSEYKDGVKTQGGYSTAIRANKLFVFNIPDAVSSEDACSMLCGGLTVFHPLKNHGCKPGAKVGIVGIGGLGHYAVLFAKAMGAEVYAFTTTANKEADLKKMGADHVIVADKEGKFAEKYGRTLDLIVATRDVAGESFPFSAYMSMLWIRGHFIMVGMPDEPIPEVHPGAMMSNGSLLGSSHIGSKAEAIEMLDIAATKGVKPWIEVLPMKEAKKAIEGVHNNKVRYRYVLEQDIVKY